MKYLFYHSGSICTLPWKEGNNKKEEEEEHDDDDGVAYTAPSELENGK